MSIAVAMLFLGLILVIAGIKNVSVKDALRGNFDVPKPATTSLPSTGATTG